MRDSRSESMEKFARELRRVHLDVGQPSVEIVQSISNRPGAVQLSSAAVTDVLSGRRVPSWEFVVGFVSACEAYMAEHGPRVPPGVFNLDHLRRPYDLMLEELGQPRDPAVRTSGSPGFSSSFQESEVRRLSGLADDLVSSKDHTPVIVVTGPAGVGKTSIVNQFAGETRRGFPNGVYWLSLNPSETYPGLAESIADILSSLGVSGKIPETLAARCALLRELLDSLEVLLIVDDVTHAHEVSPLVPGTSSKSLVIVISTEDPDDVPGRRLAVRPADIQRGVALMREFIGEDKFKLDPQPVTFVAQLAGGMPVALRIFASLMSSMPGGSREVANKLQQFNGQPGAVPIGDVLARAYELLSPDAALILRALACADRVSVPVQLIPFLMGQEEESAGLRAALDDLVKYSFISIDGDLICLHQLIASLGRAKALEQDTAEWVAAIADRAQRISFLAGAQPQPEPMIASDYWTIRDQLSHAYYADAVADFIRHRQTLPPLTIGLNASWGSGKTSLMRMIQHNLDPRYGERPSRLQLDAQALGPGSRAGRLLLGKRGRRHGRSSAITNLDILRQTNAAEERPEAARPDAETGADEALTGPLRAELADGMRLDPDAWRPTVWFNPWMYQNGEQIWAGLVYEIISQVTERLGPVDRELFWLLLNLARVDSSVVRRRWYRLLCERLLPLVAGWTVAIAITLISLLLAQLIPPLREAFRYLSGGLSGVGTVVLLIGGAINVLTFLNRRAVGSLSSLVRKPDIVSGSKDWLAEQFKESFDQVVPDPGYGSRLGFLHLVQTDMRRVLRLVATPTRPLVVFVDDLDRCSPGAISQVIEAINLFLAGEFPNCVFVLGMEPSAVALHIETAYPDLVKAHRDSHPDEECSSLGWRFLEKVIQLPLGIHVHRTDDDVAKYLQSLMQSSVVGPPASSVPGSRAVNVATTPAPRGITVPRTDGSAAPLGDDISPYHAPDVARVGEMRVDEMEKAILARRPSPETIRRVALEVQLEVLGEPAPILPVTLAAVGRISATLYSDADAYNTLKDALSLLPSRNPREIKRFVNLFRFYSFIAERGRLIGGPAASKEQIAKMAAFAIRWPHLVSMLAARPDGDGRMQAIENAARADDVGLWDKAVRENFPGLVPTDAQIAAAGDPQTAPDTPQGRNRELRRFMREGAEIESIAYLFL